MFVFNTGLYSLVLRTLFVMNLPGRANLLEAEAGFMGGYIYFIILLYNIKLSWSPTLRWAVILELDILNKIRAL